MMAAMRGRLLLLALAAIVLRDVTGQSVLQCPVPTGFTGTLNTAQKQVVQWCRFAEQGSNSAIGGNKTLGTRFWGSPLGETPDGSVIDVLGNSNPAGITLANVGPPGSSAGATFNSTCTGNQPPLSGDLDGPGGTAYLAASVACSTNQASFYAPTSCPVSMFVGYSYTATHVCKQYMDS